MPKWWQRLRPSWVILARPRRLECVFERLAKRICCWSRWTRATRQSGLSRRIGVCIIEVGFRVEILGWVVSSSARRRGIARRLIEEAETWAKNIGANAISVRSTTKRIEAHLFYPALGYKKIKTQAVYENTVR